MPSLLDSPWSIKSALCQRRNSCPEVRRMGLEKSFHMISEEFELYPSILYLNAPPSNLGIRISSVEFVKKTKWNETLRGFYCLKIQEMVTNKFTKRYWVKWSERQFLSRKVLCLQIQCKDISAGCAIIVPLVSAHQSLAVSKTQLLLRSETNRSREVFPYDLRGIWVIPLNFVFLTVHRYFGYKNSVGGVR